jgi:outer membrane protein assembly factor BamD (BamD/ComL family)
MRLSPLTAAALLLAVPLHGQKQRDDSKSGYDNAARATVLHVANVYVTPDSATPAITTIGVGHEVVLTGRNGPWVNVFVNVDRPDDSDPDSVPAFEDPHKPGNGPSSGWIRDKGIVGPATPHGDILLYGAAAELEAQAAQPHPPIDAAAAAHRLYARVVDYFPDSHLAPEAAFRAADIRWQLDKADISTLPSAHEQQAYLRPQIYEGELKWVMRTYPNTPFAARAAFDLLDNQLCGDWQGLPQCPEQETKLYYNYATHYPGGPKSAEALYLAAYRQGVLVTMYNVQENDRLAAGAARNCQSIAGELERRYPESDYAARAQSIAFRVAQGIPITGSDRD